MAAPTWKCRMPGCGTWNDPNDQFREVGPNTCANCGRWRYLLHAIGAGGLGVLVLIIVAVVWVVGMPERTYREKYTQYLKDGRIDEEENEELAKIAEKYKLSRDVIRQIERDVTSGKPLDSGKPLGSTRVDEKLDGKELSRLLRKIYRDGVKEFDEQRQIDDFLRQYPLDPNRLAQLEQEIRDKMNQSQMSLKQCLVYIAQKQYQAAVKECEHSANFDPENDFAWANLCAAHAALRQDEQARSACNEALRLDPENWLAHYNLATLHARRNEIDEALNELSEVLRVVVKDPKKSKAELKNDMRTDPDLRRLRSDPRFQRLLAQN